MSFLKKLLKCTVFMIYQAGFLRAKFPLLVVSITQILSVRPFINKRQEAVRFDLSIISESWEFMFNHINSIRCSQLSPPHHTIEQCTCRSQLKQKGYPREATNIFQCSTERGEHAALHHANHRLSLLLWHLGGCH